MFIVHIPDFTKVGPAKGPLLLALLWVLMQLTSGSFMKMRGPALMMEVDSHHLE